MEHRIAGPLRDATKLSGEGKPIRCIGSRLHGQTTLVQGHTERLIVTAPAGELERLVRQRLPAIEVGIPVQLEIQQREQARPQRGVRAPGRL